MPFTNDTMEAFGNAIETMERLRAPGGCPWDREQTMDSIRQYTLEETYEVFDAIERRNWNDLKDELGDLLLQVLFYAEMAREMGEFDIGDVARSLHRKLVRRHPHVFGDVKADTAERVVHNWEQLKQQERAAKVADKPSSLLDEVPRGMPAAQEAQKLGSRAAKVGFDWPDEEGLFAKLAEETRELREAMALPEGEREARVASEVGDLLFTTVQLARHLGVNAEMALRGTNARFRSRFAAMERAQADEGKELRNLPANELEALWAKAKAEE